MLSEKFQRSGSCEVTTVSRVKSRWMRSRVCCQEGPVQTVAGSTKCQTPFAGPELGRGRGHEGCAESGGSGRVVRPQAA